jgi:hypothetical protein
VYLGVNPARNAGDVTKALRELKPE